MERTIIYRMTSASMVMAFLFSPLGPLPGGAEAKLDCSPTANTSVALPRTVAIASNLAGTGAHALASGLSAVASKVTTMSAKVQPYNGPNAWMPLLEEGEIEFGIINILDSNMAATGTGNYKKAYPTIRIVSGGVFPFTGSIMVRDKSEIKTGADLKGKRMAWDFGGHAITQTWQNAAMEVLGVKPSDVTQVRFSNLNDAIRGVPEGKVDATFAAIGIGINEEANAMEPIRFLALPNTAASNKILGKYGGSIAKQEPTAGIRAETTVIGYPLHLASSTKVSDKTVSTLLKAWWDNLGELQTIHPQFKKWTKDVQAITNFTVPYHTGAVKFYKEVGVWSAKHDARTKELCG